MNARRAITLAGTSLGIVALAALGGYFPTRRLAGEGALEAMLAGCGVGLLANWIGLGVWAFTASADKGRGPQALLLATAVRFLSVLALTLAAALSGVFAKAPLLIWVGLSYLTALAVETVGLARANKRSTGET